MRYGWQASAGLYAALSRQPGQAEASAPAPEDLVDRALATGDEHAFKVLECCLRENAIRPNPAYLKMAHDVIGRLA